MTAACKGQDPAIWFPVGTPLNPVPDYSRARAICGECPIRQACLDGAMDRQEEHGMWGMMTPRERRDLAPTYRRACPGCGNRVLTGGRSHRCPDCNTTHRRAMQADKQAIALGYPDTIDPYSRPIWHDRLVTA